MNKFSGKVVLITGASSGIGAALAREFHREGARLILLARREDRLKALAQEFSSDGRQAFWQRCDVTDGPAMRDIVGRAVREIGPLDVVVANAGFGVVGDCEQLSEDDFRRQFETNVFGVLTTVHATLDSLKKTRGRLALMGSVSGYVAQGGNSPYCMSKFAVRALADSLYFELRRYGISVTHIAPGFVVSEIRQVDNRGLWHAEYKERLPMWLQMPTEKAARKIVSAVYCRRRERVITTLGWWLVRAARYVPGLLAIAIRKFHVTAREEPN